MKPFYVCHIFKTIRDNVIDKCADCNKLQEYSPDEVKVLLQKHYRVLR